MKSRPPSLWNPEGAVTLPLALLLGCALFATLGAWSLLRQERRAESLELDILNCIGYRAQLFRDLQNEIEDSNATIRATRAAIAASTLLPAALPELITALNAAASWQELSLTAYRIQSMTWRLAPPCRGGAGNSISEAPRNTPWRRPPPDPIGPLPLETIQPRGEAHEFSIRARAGRIKRSASAHVVFDSIRDRWTSHWGGRQRPRRILPLGAITP